MNRLFNRKKTRVPEGPSMGKRRLERRNAAKHIDYDAASSSSSLEEASVSSSSSTLVTRSLELHDRRSFRIEGNEGDFLRICRSLGFSGPEDFAIPADAWEASKVRSTSDVLPRIRSLLHDSPRISVEVDASELDSCAGVAGTSACKGELSGTESSWNGSAELDDRVVAGSSKRAADSSRIDDMLAIEFPRRGLTVFDDSWKSHTLVSEGTPNNAAESRMCAIPATCGGINGVRPPVLKPPPAMTLPVIDYPCSAWDMFRDFAPESERGYLVGARRQLGTSSSSSSGEEEEVDEKDKDEEDRRPEQKSLLTTEDDALLSEAGFFTTSNDDASSCTTERSNVSPNSKLRRTITSWQKGELLGSGSFGSVYEGISADGFFFAIKEVSLLEQGSQAQQSIYQLQQEIDLLSQFEHENIVQYYGTDKDERKLYIFLELVTKGSLLNLYKTYRIVDSLACAYTRQILQGLKYLHDRGVLHRDIKCANILVDASGSVKLVDFGLAKATKLNDAKSFKGSPFWMAPEVVNGKTGGYGFPADIWSLGCTVLEMLTGRIPYSDFEPFQALYRIGKGIPPTVPDTLSADARDFILLCLNVEPIARPTAAQLLHHQFVKRPPPPTSLGSASPYRGARH